MATYVAEIMCHKNFSHVRSIAGEIWLFHAYVQRLRRSFLLDLRGDSAVGFAEIGNVRHPNKEAGVNDSGHAAEVVVDRRPDGEVVVVLVALSLQPCEVERPVKDEVAIVRHDGAGFRLGHPEVGGASKLGLKHDILYLTVRRIVELIF